MHIFVLALLQVLLLNNNNLGILTEYPCQGFNLDDLLTDKSCLDDFSDLHLLMFPVYIHPRTLRLSLHNS